MRIDVHMKPYKLTKLVSQRLQEKLRLSLGAFASGIAEVHFILDAKPQGESAARSAMVKVNFNSGGRLILESRGVTVGQAAAKALSRVRSAVEREMIRRWEWVDSHLPPNQRMRMLRVLPS